MAEWHEGLDAIREELVRCGRATWRDIGTFTVARRRGRDFNPDTGEPIPESRLVRFAPSQAFRAQLAAAQPTHELVRVLLANRAVDLPGFGWLELKDYPAYQGRNPRTGEVVAVPAKRGVFFGSAPELRAAVADAPPAESDED